MQVEHIRLTLGLKALGFQPVESTSLSKLWFQIVDLHPYTTAAVNYMTTAFNGDTAVANLVTAGTTGGGLIPF